MITIKSQFQDDPFADLPGAIPEVPVPDVQIEDTEDMTIRFLGENEGVESVLIWTVHPIGLWERPRIGTWKFWRWRPWLRFMRQSWEFDAEVEDHGDGDQTFTIIGQVTESVTFHREEP